MHDGSSPNGSHMRSPTKAQQPDCHSMQIQLAAASALSFTSIRNQAQHRMRLEVPNHTCVTGAAATDSCCRQTQQSIFFAYLLRATSIYIGVHWEAGTGSIIAARAGLPHPR